MLLAIAMTLAPINYAALLSSIAQVEGNNWEIRGGGLQWTPDAWNEETKFMSFTLAMHKPTAMILASIRLHRMAARLNSEGIHPTPYSLALTWHYGYDGAKERLTLLEANDYGTRVQNLYDEIEKEHNL